MGGTPVEWYVAWLWPLRLGHAYVEFPSGTSNFAYALMKSGGIITCLTAALISELVIYRFFKHNQQKPMKFWIFLLPHIFFWYGFWAYANSVGYLLVGSILNFGDISGLAMYAGISPWLFVIPGFLFFTLLYYVISLNFYNIFRSLITLKPKWTIFIFWLYIPVLYVLFNLNPGISLNIISYIFGFAIMFIPSVFSFITIHFKWQIWSRLYSKRD